MMRVSKTTKDEINDVKKALDDFDQGLYNHIALYHQQGIMDLLENLREKAKNLRDYADILKGLYRGKRKKIGKIDGLIIEIKKIMSEINRDTKGRLRYPLYQQLDPISYLSYYLSSLAPYVLEKISKLREIEIKLSEFDPT